MEFLEKQKINLRYESLQSQTEGYVDYMDYTECQTFTGKAVSGTEKNEYTRPHSQYVGMIDYADSLHLPSYNYSHIPTSSNMEEASPQEPSDGYERFKDSLMTSDKLGYSQLLKEQHEYLEILEEPENLQSHSAKTRPQSQYVGHLEFVEYPDSEGPEYECENN